MSSPRPPSTGGLSRYNLLPAPVKAVFLLAPVAALLLFILHWFSVPVFGSVLAGTAYYYLLYAVLGFNVFMGLGATRKQSLRAPPWYDYLAAFTMWGIAVFFLMHAGAIASRAWDTPPDGWTLAAALVLGLLSIEAGRRVAGWGYTVVLVLAAVYPLFASSSWLLHHLDGVLYGVSIPFKEIIGSFAYGADGILGVPSSMLGELILGFFIFAGLIMGMGGGDFFMKLATALMGRVRGGQAKIAVLASGFFGSITGSPIANIAGTGSFTIPAMKKAGYSPEYAAAIEACASTGSDTMPPVLGGLAFIMIVISGADYGSVVIAAFLPSLLFYLGLLVQVDAYAARNRMKALPREEIPPLWPVLREGWVYLVGIAALLVGLVYLRWGAITPVYATAIIIVLQLLSWLARRALPSDMPRPTLRQTLEAAWGRTRKGLVQAAGLINYTVAIFIGMGFILVGVLKTGMAGGLTNWIVGAGGSSIYLILGVCFAFSLFMGMFGLQRTGYLFLALIAVPAIVTLSRTMPEFAATGGLPAMGLNLFLIFYAGLGGLTPPVALNSFIAANISGANPMKTAWLSLRLGAVLLFLPFFFVLQPSLLILYTPWWQTLLHFAQAAAGIWLLSSGLEGYLIGAGELRRPERALLVAGGVLVAFPQVAALAAGCAIVTAAAALILTRKRPAASPAEETLDNKTEAIR